MPGPATNSTKPLSYNFGDFRVDPAKRLLLRRDDDGPVPLTPKAFDTLLHLVEHQGEVVTKEELMRAIWPDTIVEENNLNQNISALRRVLGESRGQNRYIVTIPGRGYRFTSPITGSPQAPRQEPDHVTVGVLPFENIGAGLDREYLADGLTEETIASLGQIDPGHISVIGRTSVMTYKRTTKTLAEIGRELDTAYLIESSLRAEGGRLRITSKLIRVSDQVRIWSASYDSEPSSMLAFQRELSITIAEQIRLRLSPERLTALAKRQTQNPAAYDLYLRGRHVWNLSTPPTTRRAIEYFSHATDLDPNYALAWSGLADAYSGGPINGDAVPLVVRPRAREAVAHALSVSPELPEVLASLGFLKFWLDWEWPAAEAAFRRAITFDPSYAFAHRMLGVTLSHMRRHEEAASAMRRARELDPLYAMHHALSSQLAFAGRRYSEALQFARQAIVVDPEFWIGYMQLAQVCVQLGDDDLAMDALNRAGRTSGGNTKIISLRGYYFARMGQISEAQDVLDTLQAIARERYVPPYTIALVYAGLEQPDAAFEWLERASEARDVHLIFLPIDPKWDAFRSDSRFQSILKRCEFTSLE
ncbi:MAG: winged helix-turn-helix domain-containing protein [Acidobacteriaceae bacterium]